MARLDDLLGDLADDAEDILDEFTTEAWGCKLVAEHISGYHQQGSKCYQIHCQGGVQDKIDYQPVGITPYA